MPYRTPHHGLRSHPARLAAMTLAGASVTMSAPAATAALVSGFETVTTPAAVSTTLAPERFFFPEQTTTFTSGAASFNHTYFPSFGGSGAWTYSNVTDTTTPGFTNQYAAFTGVGVNGSPNYGIANAVSPVEVMLRNDAVVEGAYFTNTTYAALAMQNGDSFAKTFGGQTGDDPDFFLLTIEGLDAGGNVTGAVDFYLADYRFEDNANDYIVDDWTFVDLTSLGVVSALGFSLSGSDTGSFGLNTPAYFAIDDLTVVPVPAGVWLFAPAAAALGAVRRQRAV